MVRTAFEIAGAHDPGGAAGDAPGVFHHMSVRPVHGFAAETAGSGTIVGASIVGIPVSSSHIICTSIMGVGSTMGTSTVKWGIARSIIVAWILIILISALIGYGVFAILRVVIGY